MIRRARIAILIALLGAVVVGQDSRADVAARLYQLVDRKIEELRAELHKEIDAALGTPASALGLKTRPASDEFRQLHRLPDGCGQWVEAVERGSRAEQLHIRAGDVLLRYSDLQSDSPTVWLVRKGERRMVGGGILADGSPTETADQMADRLWAEAVKKVVTPGLEELPSQKTVSESHPSRK